MARILNTFEEFIDYTGLNDLTENEKEIIKKIYEFKENCYKGIAFIENKNPTIGSSSNSNANVIASSFNYIFLKNILDIKKQNNELIEQNKQIIQLLTEIKNK